VGDARWQEFIAMARQTKDRTRPPLSSRAEAIEAIRAVDNGSLASLYFQGADDIDIIRAEREESRKCDG
jgi:hypothetical protein